MTFIMKYSRKKEGLIMTLLNEKIAYMRGLCEGYGFDKNTKEGKVFNGILDILDEMANLIDVDSGIEKTEDEEYAEYSYAFICPNCGEEIEVDEEFFDETEEFPCPKCSNLIPVCSSLEDLKF